MIKTVIFDLDGTLTDSLDSIKFSADAAIGKFGFAPCDREQYKVFVGEGADVLIQRCLIHGGDTLLTFFDRVFEEYKRIFQANCMYRLTPYEGIRELLAQLKSRGKQIAVLSNKPHAQTVEVVESVFGRGYFEYILGQQEGLLKKPSPAGVYAIMNALGSAKEEILYAGDTGTDIQTGKAAGVLTAGVLWGFRTRTELEENKADIIVEKPIELLDYTD